jgi:hypothetical protein
MNRKGQMYKVFWYYLIRVPIIIFLFGLFVYISGGIQGQALTSPEVREKIIINRLFFSPNSISYVDLTIGKVYPGVIDMSKFDNDTLDSSFSTKENAAAAAKLDLVNLDTDTTVSAYINKELYSRWKSYVKFEQYSSYKDQFYVTIKDNGKEYPGLLKVNVLMHNG